MKKRIVIIGGRGTAVVIAEQIQDAIDRFKYDAEILGFAIDDPAYGGSINGYPIVAGVRDAYPKYKKEQDIFFIYSLYRSDVMKDRIDILNSLSIPHDRFLNFIHPTCTVSKSSLMGYGNIVLANTVINPNVKLGHHNTINSNCLIGHDSEIGDNNFLAGHVCVGSNIKIGNGNFIGLNSGLRNMINIGNYCLIGMCSNVTKSYDEQTLYGNPASPRALSGKPVR